MKKLSLLLTALAVLAVSEASARDKSNHAHGGSDGQTVGLRKAVVQNDRGGARHLTRRAVVADAEEIKDFAEFDAWASEYADNCVCADGTYLPIFNELATQAMFDDAVKSMTAQQYADSLVEGHIAFLRAFAKNTNLIVVEAGDRVVTDGIAEVRRYAGDYNRKVRGDVVSKEERKSVAQQFAEEYVRTLRNLKNIYNKDDIVHFILDNVNVQNDFRY